VERKDAQHQPREAKAISCLYLNFSANSLYPMKICLLMSQRNWNSQK